MTFKDDFKKCAETKGTNWRHEEVNELTVEKLNSFALKLSYAHSYQIIYDFLNRMMLAVKPASSSDGGNAMTTTLFKDLDREVLVAMHEKLIELGGTPPALPQGYGETDLAKPTRATAPVV